MSRDADLRRIQRLVDELESDDAFERRDAIEALAFVTQQRMGFDWGGAEEDRARAVKRWRKWLARERDQRRGREVQATIQLLAKGQIDPETLGKLLKDLPPAQKKALLAQLVIAKAAAEAATPAAPAACQRCAKRPVTVRVTSLAEDGTYRHEGLCEVCAAGLGA